MAQALYRRWRPQRWENVIGQDHIIQTLRNAVAADRVAHAYLFAGPRGTGKTTTARLLAKAVNCLEPDLANRPCDACENCLAVNQGRFLDMIEIDAASNTSVDDVRDLRDKINFSPNVGRFKVYIIDEVHMLSPAAFNALLKTLEEPPAHAIFILATTEVHKIPATVLSRCQRHEFRRIPHMEIVEHLQRMSAGEGLEVEDAALQLIARQATGSLRDAISLLDQLASANEQVSLERARQVLGTVTSQAVVDLVDYLIHKDTAAGLELIHRTLDSGSDPRQFARQIVDYLRSLLLSKLGNANQVDATAEIRERMAKHAQAIETSHLLNMIRAFNQAGNEMRSGWQPALPLEMAFVEVMEQSAGSGEEERKLPDAKPTRPTRRAVVKIPMEESPPTGVPEIETTVESRSVNPVDQESRETYEKIQQSWDPAIIKQVDGINKETAGLLRSTKLLGMRRGVLIIGFYGQILKQKMEAGNHLEITEKILTEFIGRTVPVRCLALNDRQSEIPADVDLDGMVAAALRDLGGKIVDVH
jgi:DNA polymerase-3 subunit gamma/tau